MISRVAGAWEVQEDGWDIMGGGAWRSAFAAFDTLADAVHMQHISCREHLTVFTESLTRKVSGVFLSLVVKESSRI